MQILKSIHTKTQLNLFYSIQIKQYTKNMPEWLSVGEEVKGSGERKERREREKEGTEEQRKEGRRG